MLAAVLGVLVLGVTAFSEVFLPLGICVTALALVLHSSLTHEVLHGHPFPSRIASEALAWVQPGLFVPYLRFRDLHLAHHQDARLTDPYDDPESNYLEPAVWARLPAWRKRLLDVNNTLAGRLLVGPLIGQAAFLRDDWRAIRAGDRQSLRGWVLHLPGVAVVVGLVVLSPMPLWAYLLACYLALSILRIRTFLEHRAHVRASGRTVIIEDRGLLAFLFLNNNLHVVHHMHPRVPWYRLPALYHANRQRYITRNHGYVYRSYRQIFGLYFWRRKDEVAHPLWQD
ncbi:fatty acid desaturase [Sulfitobacter sp. D35]|nr:fatty acid desaturase [Sulfitobacter sp. D35]MDW4496625.1 fatty acid desaturase [Sulfitobacter sp. D35]